MAGIRTPTCSATVLKLLNKVKNRNEQVYGIFARSGWCVTMTLPGLAASLRSCKYP